ncbi:aldehyde dehydrogenase family protein [Gordonia spumicola]|uniref:aldehyde dehydrogenase family protein n=1 Tax=Gordonia spumicola TaxID=589161 RepID=UPI001E5AE8C8|nr:aldehyde dehydrogenase family protein [Gordonia spumicola]
MASTTDQSIAAVDQAIADLTAGESRWGALSLTERADLFEQVRDLVVAHGAEWVDAAISIKRLDPGSPLVGEEWMSGPYAFAGGLGVVAQSLRALAAGDSPLKGATFGESSGHTTVQALPAGLNDMLLLSGFSAQVWLQKGISRDDAIAAAGLAQLDPTVTGGVGAVLGAGNIMSIAPLDTLYELAAFNRVVALKLNPVTDALLPTFRTVFAPLIEIGAVRILTGGADVGKQLVEHPGVAHVHMTGSAVTHDAIVWGTGPEAADRKKAGTPLLSVPVTSELGGVSPTIVLPGKWSKADIAFQAAHVATQRLHNGGYNCVAAQSVIVSSDWAQREEFLAALRSAFDTAPARPAYYPGSDSRVDGAVRTYPDAERLGPNGGRVLVDGLTASSDEPLLTTEYFAPVLGVVELPGTGADFARAAVDAANDEFAGTLGINLIAHPTTIAELGSTFDELIADLRYGTIAVNAWTGLGFLTPTATWGAFPGHTIDDVQSGIGVVHNAWLIDRPERTVIRGPFRPAPRSVLHAEWALSPKPPWFVNNKSAATTGRLLARFAGAPSLAKLPAIVASALRG